MTGWLPAREIHCRARLNLRVPSWEVYNNDVLTSRIINSGETKVPVFLIQEHKQVRYLYLACFFFCSGGSSLNGAFYTRVENAFFFRL